MRVGSFIARRITSDKLRAFSGLVVNLSVVATALGVVIMILTLAFISGFQQEISNKVYGFWGNIRVQQHLSYSTDISDEVTSNANDTVINILKRNPTIKSVDPYATKATLIKSKANMEGIMLKGVNKDFTKDRMLPFMIKGNWLNFDTANPAIVISAYTARILELDTGQKVFLYFMNKENGLPRIRSARVCGIFKTAIEEYDRTFAIVDIGLIQKLQNWGTDRISGYEITLNDNEKDELTSGELMDQMPLSWYATPVKEIYPNIFDWLDLQDLNRTMIIVIMCIVAIINLISCLLILILERSKMIGLLKAVGAKDIVVQEIFWKQGLFVSLRGVFWGNIIGLFLCWLQQTTGIIRLDEAAYYLKVAPIQLVWWHVLAVNIITIGVCFIVLLIPSLLVRKIQPVKALRFQ